ncbi:MAG: hypothetical protein BGP22_16535 [Variovorax sp. 67-131]|nr:MAG: hypothetical protein BGP22_16535 [Variovorax sp. 67-131]
MPSWNDFKQIGVNGRARDNLQIQFFPNLSYQAVGRCFAKFDAPSGQLPLFSLVEKQHDFAQRCKQNAFDRYRKHLNPRKLFASCRHSSCDLSGCSAKDADLR